MLIKALEVGSVILWVLLGGLPVIIAAVVRRATQRAKDVEIKLTRTPVSVGVDPSIANEIIKLTSASIKDVPVYSSADRFVEMTVKITQRSANTHATKLKEAHGC